MFVLFTSFENKEGRKGDQTLVNIKLIIKTQLICHLTCKVYQIIKKNAITFIFMLCLCLSAEDKKDIFYSEAQIAKKNNNEQREKILLKKESVGDVSGGVFLPISRQTY